MDVTCKFSKKDNLFDTKYPFYAIIEVASNNDPDVVPEESERLMSFIEEVGDSIEDGIVPQGEGQAQLIWELRENIAPAIYAEGFTLGYDVSLDTKYYY